MEETQDNAKITEDADWNFTDTKWEFPEVKCNSNAPKQEPDGISGRDPSDPPSLPESPLLLPYITAEMANMAARSVQHTPLNLPTITPEMAALVRSKVEVTRMKVLPRLRFFSEVEIPQIRDLVKTAKKGWGRGSDVRAHLKRLQRSFSINKTF